MSGGALARRPHRAVAQLLSSSAPLTPIPACRRTAQPRDVHHRTLQAVDAAGRAALADVAGHEQVRSLRFVNGCPDKRLSFRVHFSFNGKHPWFEDSSTRLIPRPFVDVRAF